MADLGKLPRVSMFAFSSVQPSGCLMSPQPTPPPRGIYSKQQTQRDPDRLRRTEDKVLITDTTGTQSSAAMVDVKRCVCSARVIGVMHRDSPKVKLFMTSVLWSDDSEVIIYRSFQEFKKFHRQLKKRFPLVNPLQRSNRLIPKFRARSMKSSLQQKGSSRSVVRMRFLEDYCSELLRCDLTVTQNSVVTQFFMPKDHDLQPDFTKNSIMILPSDVLPDGSAGREGEVNRHSARNITYPFVTQTYCCVATYETKDTNNRPFKVAMDEKLDVLLKDPTGWWLVENEDKRLAWFPAPYLKTCEEEDYDDDEGFILGGSLYCAVRSYSTKKNDEVSVTIGSVVEVLRTSDNGWWLIRCNGKAGYVPSMYLQPFNNPRAGLYNLQTKLYRSNLNLATNNWNGSSVDLAMTPIVTEENNPLQGSSRSRPEALRAQRDASTSDSRMRSMSYMSTESDLSSVSSGSSSSSDSSSSCKEQLRSHPGRAASSPWSSVRRLSSPDLSPCNDTTTSSAISVFSKGDNVALNTPRVPPRPKAQEILTRCTTMTRKAALASQARLHSRLH